MKDKETNLKQTNERLMDLLKFVKDLEKKAEADEDELLYWKLNSIRCRIHMLAGSYYRLLEDL